MFFFFPLSASGRRHPERFHSAPSCEWLSCCKRLQGLCWIASAAAGFFSSVSVSVRRDDGWTRAACRRRPTKIPVSVRVWRTKEEDGERTRRNRGWLLITWRGVGFSVKVFFLSGANFTLQMFLHDPAIPPEWQKSILHFFCLLCPLPNVWLVQQSVCPCRRLQTDG